VVSGGVVEGLWFVLTLCEQHCSPLWLAGILVFMALFAVSFAIAVLCVCCSLPSSIVLMGAIATCGSYQAHCVVIT
jgi:hypothetical protein